MRRFVLSLWVALMVGLGVGVESGWGAESPMAEVAAGLFERLRSQAWLPAWKDAEVEAPRRFVQKPARFAPEGFDPVWRVTVRQGSRDVGYFMFEDKAPHRLLDFGVDAAEAFSNGHPACVGIEGVPNLQQFAVRGKRVARAASGCVPTAAANVMGYWAKRGLGWWLDSGEEGEVLRAATLRLRGDLRWIEIEDDAGYTEDGMALTGSHAEELARTMGRDAERYGVPLRVRAERFQRAVFEGEIRAGRPVVVCGEARLPHKPELGWGHALTGIGWAEVAGEYFVMMRDNFYPSVSGNAVRWLRVDCLVDLVVVAPE